jgi:hypothetical protein
MRITIMKAAPHMWYSDMIGQTFEVIKVNAMQYVFSVALFFNGDDVQETKEQTGFVTSLNLIGEA